jgi:hypothetical protein
MEWFLEEKKFVEYKMCVFISLQVLSKRFLILSRIQRDVIINVYRPSCKVSLILVRFQSNSNFSDFGIKLKCKISWNSIQWELSCFMWGTDMTTLIVSFRNGPNTPKNYTGSLVSENNLKAVFTYLLHFYAVYSLPVMTVVTKCEHCLPLLETAPSM